MKRTFILGHFGGFNTGDEAMLGGFLSTLPDTMPIFIKYKNGVIVDWGKNVTLFHGSYTDFVKSIGPDDTLVLCGGTHFHDDYSPVRLIRHWLYLARINYLFAQAKRKGARTLCIGNGFGPISRVVTRYLTKEFVKLCDIVTVRDNHSLRILTSLECKVNLVHPDLAMLLYQPDRAIEKKNIVGVSLTSLKAQSADSISDDELVERTALELTAFARAAKDTPLIRLFVIRSGDRESDAPIMNQLHSRLQENNVRSEIYSFTNDLNDLIDQMLPCRVFLASRFHSAVLSAVCQNQLIILSYHKKLTSLADDMLMISQHVVDLQQSNAATQLNGLSKTIAELYTTSTLNYSFPATEILRLGDQIRATYEKGSDLHIHTNLRRSTQPGEPTLYSTTEARI